MRLSLSIFAAALVLLTGSTADHFAVAEDALRITSLEQLRAGFQSPPPQARLRCYWWWLNGNTDKQTITHDLEEMKAKGFGGAILVDADGSSQLGNREVKAGPLFGSPAWVELYTHALREADRLGLEITLNITSGWNLGGPYVRPEDASKILTYSRLVIPGGKVAVHLEKPATKNGFYRDIAVLAYPLSHGSTLAPQPNDHQGDRHTASARQRTNDGAQTLAFRSAARESGFSMPDSSAMLDAGTQREFASERDYSDAKLGDVRVLTASMQSDGALKAELPAGEWELLRIGYTDSDARVSTASGEWQGLAIDYLSRRAFETYWQRTVEPLLHAAKPFHSLRYLATDSWELGGTNWTDDFRERFIKLRGYDPVPFLPVVAGRIVNSREESTRFLTDLRRTVADLISTEHYDVFAEKAAANGLGVQAESGGPHGAPIDALETFRHSSVPQTEFWSRNNHRTDDRERFFTKEAASAANIYGQRFVAQEGETSIGPHWSASLAENLKPSFDMAITEGMNRLVWHEFTSSPASTGLPGQEYFAGTHLNPKVTWWNAGQAFFDYLNRVQFIMQQGTPVNDVLYFYGDHVPNFVRLKADDPAQVLPGYDYDVTNEDALLRTLKIDGREIVGPSGVRWKVLVLPKTRRVSMQVLQFTRRYLEAGGTVASLPPISVTGRITSADQHNFDALVSEIWKECAPGSHHAFGKGIVVCSASGRDALKVIRVPEDMEIEGHSAAQLAASSSMGVDYIHRQIAGADVYFVRNANGAPVDFSARLRATGRAQQWDPVTGSITSLAPSVNEGRSTLTLHLPAFGSTFVVFSPAGLGDIRPDPVTVRSNPLQVSSWTVTFQSGRGAPTKPYVVHQLKSWTEWKDPGVQYFSGTATYRALIDAPQTNAGEETCLQFADVREIAEIFVDEKPFSTVWAKPYIACSSALLAPGRHKLEVRVTNLWHNRVMGDLQPGAQKLTKTNINAQPAPLLPSGLIGPITWVIRK